MTGPEQSGSTDTRGSSRYNVCPAAELPEGERRVVVIGGRSIGVFNVGGRLFALRNRCPHQGGPLCDGRVFVWLESERPGHYRYDDDRYLVECPWHGWEFDLATGQSWFDPARARVRPYPVAIERARRPAGSAPGQVEPGPYTAEAFPVTIDEDCVIVDLGA